MSNVNHALTSMRQLQQQSACPGQEQLGGISTGGWIALSLFIGMFFGSVTTILVESWRRRRELRYMDKGPAVRQSMVMMQALPASHTPGLCSQQPCLPTSTAPLPVCGPPSVAGSAGVGGANKYFSPLNTNKGQGSVVGQLSELRSSIHLGSDNGGDTHSVAASDQLATRDKNSPLVSQAQGLSNGPREFSQHGMRLQQHSKPGAAWGTPASAAQGSRQGQQTPPGMQQNKLDQMAYGLVQVPVVGTQLPQEVSSSILSADGPLHAEDSSPASVHKAAAVPAGQHIAGPGAAGNPAAHVASAAAPGPSPRQGAQLLGSPVKGAAVAAAAAAGSVSSPEGPVGDAKQLPSPSATATEIEDEYEESDLDDDWKALLGGVDARLKLQGARAMNPRERAVAIKKLLVATGTRGVEFALNTTLQEVLNFRQVHGH